VRNKYTLTKMLKREQVSYRLNSHPNLVGFQILTQKLVRKSKLWMPHQIPTSFQESFVLGVPEW